jgi:hypothetical protein
MKFGQVWRKNEKNCQKFVQLLTGLKEKREKLSEVGAISDRFGGKL